MQNTCKGILQHSLNTKWSLLWEQYVNYQITENFIEAQREEEI